MPSKAPCARSTPSSPATPRAATASAGKKPSLGLFEFNGSKENNIVWAGPGTHNFAPFRDANPDCPPEARYKALGSHNKGLVAFHSPDGIHWTLVSEKPVITKGAFDSQNLAFWDAERGRYVDFHRHFAKGVRGIMTCTSDDFAHWTEPVWLEYPEGTPDEHLYTNQIAAYPRAPHIFMGFPKRFLPERRMHGNRMPGLSDGIFMTSRDGVLFHRWGEAWIRPGLQRERWVNRNNMTAWGIVETVSAIPGTPPELSVYSTEGYYRGESCGIRRHSLRLDGFVSLRAPLAGGMLTTKPLTFAATEHPQPPTGFEGPLAKTDVGELLVREPTFLSLPGTQRLGHAFTLSVKAYAVAAGHRRLFSAYDGGAVKPGDRELILDGFFGTPSPQGDCLRFWYDGLQISAKAKDLAGWSEMAKGTALLATVTWQDGLATLYVNGKQMAQGKTEGAQPVELRLGDLRFGEDYPPTSLANEPFLGIADDILVVKRALSAQEVATMATEGAKAVVREGDQGVLYQAEGTSPRTLEDALGLDGTITLPTGGDRLGRNSAPAQRLHLRRRIGAVRTAESRRHAAARLRPRGLRHPLRRRHRDARLLARGPDRAERPCRPPAAAPDRAEGRRPLRHPLRPARTTIDGNGPGRHVGTHGTTDGSVRALSASVRSRPCPSLPEGARFHASRASQAERAKNAAFRLTRAAPSLWYWASRTWRLSSVG